MSETWPEIEIADLPPLPADEASLLEMHSVLNTISLLVGELNLIGLALTGNLEWMKSGLTICQEMIQSLRDREQAIRCAAGMGNYRLLIARAIDQSLSLYPTRRKDPGIVESLENIDSVFDVLALRAREILARAAAPEKWELIQIADLNRDLGCFFSAMEKNSKGRYRIVFNEHRQNSRDYWVNFSVNPTLGEEVRIPSILIDVMRDLMANARKYSFPGAVISANLRQEKAFVCFVVEDTGRGIPTAEIQSVVHFGIRGSNVSDVRTMGGGFGLTKALCITKQFKGRMWIASSVGKGTRIRLEIPMPGVETEKTGS